MEDEIRDEDGTENLDTAACNITFILYSLLFGDILPVL